MPAVVTKADQVPPAAAPELYHDDEHERVLLRSRDTNDDDDHQWKRWVSGTRIRNGRSHGHDACEKRGVVRKWDDGDRRWSWQCRRRRARYSRMVMNSRWIFVAVCIYLDSLPRSAAGCSRLLRLLRNSAGRNSLKERLVTELCQGNSGLAGLQV